MKRLLSLLLALSMMCSLAAVPAYAESGSTETETETVLTEESSALDVSYAVSGHNAIVLDARENFVDSYWESDQTIEIPFMLCTFGLYSGETYYVNIYNEAEELVYETTGTFSDELKEEALIVSLEAGTLEAGTYYVQFYASKRVEESIDLRTPFHVLGLGEHLYGEGVVTKEATCAEAGEMTYICQICGIETVEEIPALPHTEHVVEGEEATCTDAGLTDGVICDVCGAVLTEQEVIEATGHAEQIVPGVEATCIDTGLTEGVICTVCGEVLVEQEVIEIIDHTEQIVAGVEATCTDTGLTEGVICAVCGEVLVAQEEIPTTDHNWDEGAVTTEPTYLATGVLTYTCTNCGEESTEEIAVRELTRFKDDDGTGSWVWASDAIYNCVMHDIIRGMGDGTFRIDDEITRAQFVTMLYRLAGKPEVTGENPFTDAPANWYQKAVIWAVENGITAGTSATTFSPNAPLTREQLVTFLYRYLVKFEGAEPATADLSVYTDLNELSAYATEAMTYCVANKIVYGTSATTLAPKSTATRGQAAAIFARTFLGE